MSHVSVELRRVLERSRELGFLGERPIDEVVEHARAFVAALPTASPVDASSVLRVVDLGAGGGIPGLVIVHDRPDLHVTLVDRRSKRTDFLSLVTMRLGWAQRTTVLNIDVAELAARGERFAACVARGFGPPEMTLGWCVRLVAPGGSIVISEPPSGDRWPAELVVQHGLERLSSPDSSVVVFRAPCFT